MEVVPAIGIFIISYKLFITNITIKAILMSFHKHILLDILENYVYNIKYENDLNLNSQVIFYDESAIINIKVTYRRA